MKCLIWTEKRKSHRLREQEMSCVSRQLFSSLFSCNINVCRTKYKVHTLDYKLSTKIRTLNFNMFDDNEWYKQVESIIYNIQRLSNSGVNVKNYLLDLPIDHKSFAIISINHAFTHTVFVNVSRTSCLNPANFNVSCMLFMLCKKRK